MKKLITPILMPSWWQDLILIVPRVVIGYLLTMNFGSPKFGMPWSPIDKNLGLFEVAFWFPGDIAATGGIFAMFPIFFAWMAAFSEAVGGLALVIGFQTRIFAFLNICTMFVIIFVHQWSNGLWNMLPAIGMLWVCIYSLIIGSGRFGVDYLVAKAIK